MRPLSPFCFAVKLLLIEDEPDLSDALALALRRVGYAVEAPYALLLPDGSVTGESVEVARACGITLAAFVRELLPRRLPTGVVIAGQLVSGTELIDAMRAIDGTASCVLATAA